MQIYALNQSGERIAASDAHRHTNYHCLECSQKVRLRGGFQRRLHFFHLEKTPHCKLSEKSSLHLTIQNKLYELFQNDECILERRFPEIQRVADVCVEKKKWIFEIQCSPISLEEISKRSEHYQSRGYHLFWILHEKSFLKESITEAEYYLRFRPHFYTNIDETGEGIIYDALIQKSKSKQIALEKREVDLTCFYLFPPKLILHSLPWVRARCVFWPGYFHNDSLFNKLHSKKELVLWKKWRRASITMKVLYQLILERS